jgi:MoaA/NifB/PqqE/SkfB family radical SAM enzyme
MLRPERSNPKRSGIGFTCILILVLNGLLFHCPIKVRTVAAIGAVNHIGIHADGTVVPCCLDKNGTINLGNVKEQSLQDILNSERFIKMRDGF